MLNNKTLNLHLNGRSTFFQAFLHNPGQIGSIIPSSRILERRIVDAAGVADARLVVELGPGTGGTTRAILRSLPRHSQLLSIELTPALYHLVQGIDDRRLSVHLGNASELREILAEHDLGEPDAVISGIPFSTMPRSQGYSILEAVSACLAPEGRFVAYQVSDRVARLCQGIMGKGHSSTELLNIPPMRIYQWKKQPSSTTDIPVDHRQ